MGLSLEVDPPLTDALRDEMVALWTTVVNDGGAVGFVPPVVADDVRPTAEAALAAVADGTDRLVAGFEAGRLVALLFVADNGHRLKNHWRTLKRVMVAPGQQGKGYGGALMREATVVGRKMGLDALQVTVRGGTGTENFYARLGYREVGRVPDAIRVAPGDDREEIIMWLDLRRDR
ncbi:GNAT family N-acetyltransferase [Actinoplanes sp. NPDC089786]|uniref:GNAT family N-acetyltransferase n=1 Tax=Actinoplanes sp. NPDC089786 TaxID=3155185 RepID=UPI0034418673